MSGELFGHGQTQSEPRPELMLDVSAHTLSLYEQRRKDDFEQYNRHTNAAYSPYAENMSPYDAASLYTSSSHSSGSDTRSGSFESLGYGERRSSSLAPPSQHSHRGYHRSHSVASSRSSRTRESPVGWNEVEELREKLNRQIGKYDALRYVIVFARIVSIQLTYSFSDAYNLLLDSLSCQFLSSSLGHLLWAQCIGLGDVLQAKGVA